MGFKFSTKVKHNYFTQDYTPESVYILGLLWADGTINKKNNSITLECVKDDVDVFYPIFQTTGEYGLYVRERKNRRIQGIITCCSLELSRFLKENDYNIKSISTPSKILSKIPDDLKYYFFLGWSDGDGCFYFNEDQSTVQFTMSGTYEQDWSILSDKCNELKIEYRIDQIITKKNYKSSSFRICKGNDVIKFGDYIYNTSNFGLLRKRDKYYLIKKYLDTKPITKILCYSKNDEKIKEFDSLTDASNWINKHRNVSSDINDVIVGRQKTAFGLIWKKTIYQPSPKYLFENHNL
jgi:hypothetical protein